MRFSLNIKHFQIFKTLESQNDKESFARIQNLESHIDPLEIPSTTKLRLMCETEKIEDYSVVAPPKVLKSSPIITEED